MNKLFGKTVRFKAIASRTCCQLPNRKTVRSWKIGKTIEGVIIGGRYLKNGEIKWDDSEYFGGYKFIQEKSVFVYEVKYGFLNKSVFVLPEDITVIEKDFEMKKLALKLG